MGHAAAAAAARGGSRGRASASPTTPLRYPSAQSRPRSFSALDSGLLVPGHTHTHTHTSRARARYLARISRCFETRRDATAGMLRARSSRPQTSRPSLTAPIARQPGWRPPVRERGRFSATDQAGRHLQPILRRCMHACMRRDGTEGSWMEASRCGVCTGTRATCDPCTYLISHASSLTYPRSSARTEVAQASRRVSRPGNRA